MDPQPLVVSPFVSIILNPKEHGETLRSCQTNADVPKCWLFWLVGGSVVNTLEAGREAARKALLARTEARIRELCPRGTDEARRRKARKEKEKRSENARLLGEIRALKYAPYTLPPTAPPLEDGAGEIDVVDVGGDRYVGLLAWVVCFLRVAFKIVFFSLVILLLIVVTTVVADCVFGLL